MVRSHRTRLAGRRCVRIPASVSKSIPTPSLLRVSRCHSSKYFPFMCKPSEWDCRVQIFWGFVLFWLIFVTGNATNHVRLLYIHEMLGEGGGLWSQGLLGCKLQPSHRGLRGRGQIDFLSFHDFLVSVLSLMAPSSSAAHLVVRCT